MIYLTHKQTNTRVQAVQLMPFSNSNSEFFRFIYNLEGYRDLHKLEDKVTFIHTIGIRERTVEVSIWSWLVLAKRKDHLMLAVYSDENLNRFFKAVDK